MYQRTVNEKLRNKVTSETERFAVLRLWLLRSKPNTKSSGRGPTETSLTPNNSGPRR